jgi:CheY-like chemotaxis protein
MKMNGVDGIQILQVARSIESLHKILMLTNPEMIKYAATMSATKIKFIVKPVMPESLRKILDECFHPERYPSSNALSPPKGTRKEGQADSQAVVLVVEDNDVNREILREFLLSRGITVEEARNGLEAVKRFDEREFDAILMDIHMPMMDGFEAVRIIRTKEREGRRVPIIALTADALIGDKDKCLQSGMDDYLAKPFLAQDLYKVLSRYVDFKVPEKIMNGLTQEERKEERPPLRSLDQICEDFGYTPEIYRSHLAKFLEETPRKLEAIRKAATESYRTTFRDTIHSIKSSAGFVGATRLYRKSEEYENILRNDGPLDLPMAAEELVRLFEEVLSQAQQKGLFRRN